MRSKRLFYLQILNKKNGSTRIMIDSKILLLNIKLIIYMLYTMNVMTTTTTPTTTAMAMAAQRTTVSFN